MIKEANGKDSKKEDIELDETINILSDFIKMKNSKIN